MESPLSKEEEVVEWKGDELKKMENLKTFIIKRGRFSKGLEHLPNNLRVLEWRSYPSQDSPSIFWQKKLSICKLRESCFTSFELHDSIKVCVMNSFLSCCMPSFMLFMIFYDYMFVCFCRNL